ncbi:hypothetical protein E2C01_044701 [Portunus trituberculatus]|uniref:Uncharacterized protein n=1 Tax=Portunus trituberculatus TaxID=210409 RepID=A0A5B7FZW3_PORTR|nr:hypothetical protein [Portunus trituberculatus]
MIIRRVIRRALHRHSRNAPLSPRRLNCPITHVTIWHSGQRRHNLFPLAASLNYPSTLSTLFSLTPFSPYSPRVSTAAQGSHLTQDWAGTNGKTRQTVKKEDIGGRI